ncbi:uncharacterized protein LOC134024747 [Osmerus eperlanus]|uniref:uncharacterized protein LOC134024747 n=1 Tax=Osmerus eperlanus TaxID=29151 RepID=UPI002E13377F
MQEWGGMVQLQNTLKNLYDQYHYSPKALRELHQITEALDEKIVCDSYSVHLAHFENMASMERSPKPSPAKQVTGYLKNLHHLIFLHFMCDTLDHLALLSKEFQKDNNTVCQAVESLETCYWNLTALKTEMGPQMAKVYEAVKTNGEYRGVQFQVRHAVPSLEAERAAVIDAIIFHLEEKLRDLQRVSPVSKFKAFDPSCWPKWDRSDGSSVGLAIGRIGRFPELTVKLTVKSMALCKKKI